MPNTRRPPRLDLDFDDRNSKQKRKRTGFRGVSPNGVTTWKAEFSYQSKRTYLGTFSSSLEAALAYADRHMNVYSSKVQIAGGSFEPLKLPAEPWPMAPTIDLDDSLAEDADEIFQLLLVDQDEEKQSQQAHQAAAHS
jgi:hypothetical protein